MIKTISGIILFLAQIGLAMFYNSTIDLKIISSAAGIIFIYILYRFFTKKYDSCEIN
ncbi:MAG: hypothetical protein HY063_15020 [Bacteroidetes bacterium]|nr:hypothetical protein [Bacteroidota bacterium]